MTQITLASKDSTPQVHGPFPVTLTDIPATYGAAATLFTPNSGDVIQAAWCVATGAGPDDTVSAVVTDDAGVAISVAPFEVRSYSATGAGVSAGGAIKVRYDGPGFTAGTADIYVLVLPSGA